MASQTKPLRRKKRNKRSAAFQPTALMRPFQPSSLRIARYLPKAFAIFLQFLKRKQAYKPDSVPCLSRALIIYLVLPTHRDRTSRPQAPAYMALQPVRFTLPPLSPEARWALTPPFHPYHAGRGGIFSVALSGCIRGNASSPFREHGALCCPDFPPGP